MTKKPTVREALRDLAFKQAFSIWETPDEFHQSLLAACPDRAREIELIITAINCEIVSEMRRLGKTLIPSVLMPKLIRWLMRQTTLNHQEASWAVFSWAMALGLVPFVEDELSSSVEVQT